LGGRSTGGKIQAGPPPDSQIGQNDDAVSHNEVVCSSLIGMYSIAISIISRPIGH